MVVAACSAVRQPVATRSVRSLVQGGCWHIQSSVQPLCKSCQPQSVRIHSHIPPPQGQVVVVAASAAVRHGTPTVMSLPQSGSEIQGAGAQRQSPMQVFCAKSHRPWLNRYTHVKPLHEQVVVVAASSGVRHGSFRADPAPSQGAGGQTQSPSQSLSYTCQRIPS